MFVLSIPLAIMHKSPNDSRIEFMGPVVSYNLRFAFVISNCKLLWIHFKSIYTVMQELMAS